MRLDCDSLVFSGRSRRCDWNGPFCWSSWADGRVRTLRTRRAALARHQLYALPWLGRGHAISFVVFDARVTANSLTAQGEDPAHQAPATQGVPARCARHRQSVGSDEHAGPGAADGGIAECRVGRCGCGSGRERVCGSR